MNNNDIKKESICLNNIKKEKLCPNKNLYGFNISSGILMEQDQDKMFYNLPEFIIAKVESSELTQNLKMNINVCFIDAGRIEFKDEETLGNLGVTYSTIAKTSSKAFIRTNLKQVTRQNCCFKNKLYLW